MLYPLQTLQGAANGAARTVRATADSLTAAARATFFAGLGVVATLQEESARLFDAFVREGRAVEAGRVQTHTAEANQEVREHAARARTEVAAAAREAEEAAELASRKLPVKALEDRVAEMVTAVLQRMNVPTREDIEALKRSVEQLDKKAAELRAA